MSRRLLSAEMAQTERQLRLLAILDACERIGLVPVEMQTLHVLAYLSDALAPVWHLPILDGQVLKRRNYPFFPSTQHDLDRLVGCGAVEVSDVQHTYSRSDGWRLDAAYALNRQLADPIIEELSRHEGPDRAHSFVREVVYAASGLGFEGIGHISATDAAYSNPLVDFGGLVDIESEDGPNPTAGVAMRFQRLTRDRATLSDAETVHLYVRHLYSRMNVA
jgi:hypothetical protein